MSDKSSTPEVPRTVPKLEAELIADECAAFVGGNRATSQSETDAGIASLSADDRRELRRRLLELGVSEETVSQVVCDDLELKP
jgi:hypothetical protein